MVNIKILSNTREETFDADSIYSSIICENKMDEIISTLGSYDETYENICGFLTNGYYFVHHGQPINEYFIENILNEYDLIVSFEDKISDNQILRYFTSYEEYLMKKNELKEEISQKHPVLSGALEVAIDSRYLLNADAIIGRVGILKELYNCLADISDIENPLLAGIVIKAWIIANKKRVRTVEVRNDNPEIWNCGYQKIEVIKKYIRTVLNDYILYRKENDFEDSFAGDNPYPGNFEGLIPIWMCWWQGKDEMPELIRACIESVRRNAPTNCKVIVITLDNVNEYVTFTDSVIDKFNKGIISLTHLSDLLRVELLYRYGGMWIDATYYVPHLIDERIFEDNLYSVAFDKPLWGMDIMKGRWSSSLLSAHKNNSVIQFLMEGLWIYWDKADEVVDYFFFDYILDVGYDNFLIIQTAIDSIRKSSSAVYDLQLKMNQRFDAYDKKWLEKSADFYKLNRRNEYRTDCAAGGKTFYSYIINDDYIREFPQDNVCAFCENYIEFVEKIRELNPKRIVDYSMYMYSEGRISRGIIAELLSDDIRVDLNVGNDIPICGFECIYDSVVSMPKEICVKIDTMLNNQKCGVYLLAFKGYKDYDLIIAKKN